MTPLPVVSGRECVNALQKAGFKIQRQTGSHVILQKGTKTVSVPNHKTLKRGTLRNILRQADLTVDEFMALL
jgi:predicted RNA binding protein YcfA (HicA-like mRNA interferase family)